MERLKIGLVGIGAFGQVLLKYIRKLQEENRLNLAAVCDVRLDKCLATLEENRLGTVRAYSDYDGFLHTERQLDAVIISTPIPLHAEMGIKAFD
jgi:predicted dehydrogenase